MRAIVLITVIATALAGCGGSGLAEFDLDAHVQTDGPIRG